MTVDFLGRLVASLEAKRNVVLATVTDVRGESPVGRGGRLLLEDDGSVVTDLALPELAAAVEADARRLMGLGRSRTVTYTLDGAPSGRRDRAAHSEPGIDVFHDVHLGQLTLLVVGGGHVGACLAKVARFAGWRTVILDDRPAFANRERFPDEDEVLCGDYEAVLAEFPISSSTWVVAVTRGHKHDEIALRSVVGSPAAYVGMIGSRRRTATVLRHLREEGVPEAALARVWTPIGLDIEAETPEEIAISIVAEMIMVRRGGKGGPLSPAHQAAAQRRGTAGGTA